MTGPLLALLGLMIAAAEVWLLTTGALIAIPLLVLTAVSLAVVVSEIWADWA